jgi:serine/threonine protein kinase/tetratricopeptide (TPR) repeat protein
LPAHGTPPDPATENRGRSGSGDRDILKLGRYEVVRELGKGAMGVVYLAKDPLIGRLVALKTIRVAMHADDDETKEFQQRFIREAQAAGILNHPSIVTVHDIGNDDESGTSFIAMEYVEGQNLKEVLSQGRALSFDQIGDIIAQVAEALDFAHAKGIVHRDVKPANIILVDGTRAKITDFGIAKIASTQANLTTTGQFLGTPNYMAPEQIKGTPVDGRTDIFSLGICLFECLTRRKPFGGDSLTSISYKIVHEPFPPLQEINPQIPDGFEEVVANALAKDPTKRYQRARDMANALRAVIRGERPARPPEPMLADETIVTRDRDKLPTIEMPFPQATEVTPDLGGSTRPGVAAAGAIAAANAPAASSPAASPGGPRIAVPQRLRRTLTNVRALPLWRRRIPPYLFIGIVAVLIAALLGAVTFVQLGEPEIPVRDQAADARIAQQKQLREEANRLLAQGNTAGAYSKLEELQRLAPQSPYVLSMLQKLNAIRQQQEVSNQQQQLADAKLTEGLDLLTQRKYDEAIVRLQESYDLNPANERSAAALRRAQSERQAAMATRGRRQEPAPATATTAQTASAAPAESESKQAALTTVFIHPFTSGRIVVRAGADIVANELLYTERPARVFRRATRVARPVSITNLFPPKNADVQVWVSVPDQKIAEHHVIAARRFDAGSEHRLVVRYDDASKTFSYEIN